MDHKNDGACIVPKTPRKGLAYLYTGIGQPVPNAAARLPEPPSARNQRSARLRGEGDQPRSLPVMATPGQGLAGLGRLASAGRYAAGVARRHAMVIRSPGDAGDRHAHPGGDLLLRQAPALAHLGQPPATGVVQNGSAATLATPTSARNRVEPVRHC